MLSTGASRTVSVALAIPLALTAAAPALEPNLTVTAEDGFIVPAVVNGQTLRLRVDPGFAGIKLNPGAAARAGLRFADGAEMEMEIGPVRIPGATTSGPIRIGGWTGKRRLAWYERDVVSGADGLISIAALPFEKVTLRLRPGRPGEVRTDFVTKEDINSHAAFTHRTGSKQILVRFSLNFAASYATASAGALLADHHGGAWAGQTFWLPIVLGVTRPVRAMTFRNPVSFNGFTISRMLVRTTDYRGKYALPSDRPSDASEIVVTAKSGRTRPYLAVTIGPEHLSGCSSISYVKATRLLTLQCGRAD